MLMSAMTALLCLSDLGGGGYILAGGGKGQVVDQLSKRRAELLIAEMGKQKV